MNCCLLLETSGRRERQMRESLQETAAHVCVCRVGRAVESAVEAHVPVPVTVTIGIRSPAGRRARRTRRCSSGCAHRRAGIRARGPPARTRGPHSPPWRPLPTHRLVALHASRSELLAGLAEADAGRSQGRTRALPVVERAGRRPMSVLLRHSRPRRPLLPMLTAAVGPRGGPAAEASAARSPVKTAAVRLKFALDATRFVELPHRHRFLPSDSRSVGRAPASAAAAGWRQKREVQWRESRIRSLSKCFDVQSFYMGKKANKREFMSLSDSEFRINTLRDFMKVWRQRITL